jgi:hypothetical protein
LYQNSWGKVGRELGVRYVLEGSVRRRERTLQPARLNGLVFTHAASVATPSNLTRTVASTVERPD